MAQKVNPADLPGMGLLMAVRAKKHVTVFRRSPNAPGAGSPAQKAKFAGCAKQTKGTKNRMERNVQMSACLGGKTRKK